MTHLRIFIILTTVFICSAQTQTSFDAIRIRHNEIGFGARTLAMGGNGVASANDYSAIYWNPAGLASVHFNQISGEFSHLRFANSATFSDKLSDMENSLTRFRNFGMVVPFPTSRGSFVLAFGYNFIRDFDDYLFFNGFNENSNGLEFELPDDNGIYDWYAFDRNVYQTEEIRVEGGLHQWSFGGAIAISPSVDIGATVNFWRGKEEYTQQFFQEDTDNLYNVYPGDFESYTLNNHLLSQYKAFNMKFGGMFKLNNMTRLGLAVELPTTFTVTEDYSSSDILVFDDGYTDPYEYEPGTWQYKVKTPYRFDAGIGLTLPNLHLNASSTYQDWRQVRFQKPDQWSLDSDYQDLLDENFIIQKKYRPTLNYHLGGEISIPNSNLYLRGGYAFYPSPLEDATPDMDKKVYSGGVGLRIGHNTMLDVTYTHGLRQRQSEDIYTPGGTHEQITENRVFLSLRFNF